MQLDGVKAAPGSGRITSVHGGLVVFAVHVSEVFGVLQRFEYLEHRFAPRLGADGASLAAAQVELLCAHHLCEPIVAASHRQNLRTAGLKFEFQPNDSDGV